MDFTQSSLLKMINFLYQNILRNFQLFFLQLGFGKTNYKNFKEIQKMSYLKQKLEDYLKTDYDTDDYVALLKRDQIKTLIEVSSTIQDTIGRAAYGAAKFEKKIKPIKDTNLIKADFTPEEIKRLDERFAEIIEKTEQLDSQEDTKLNG